MSGLQGVEIRDQYLSSLQAGDVAHHSMLYPGVYPSDSEGHEALKRGETFDLSVYPYYKLAGPLIERGVHFQWLRVMPKVGEYGYDEADIAAMEATMRTIAAFGHDVRTVALSDYSDKLRARCRGAILDVYQMGIEEGDPQMSFWLTRTQQQGLGFVGLARCLNGKFDGYEAHRSPSTLPPEVNQWITFWQEVYDQAAKVEP